MRRLFRKLWELSKRFIILQPRNNYEQLAFDFLYAIGNQFKGGLAS